MTPDWSEQFQRLVLAAAVGGDLLGQLPLDPALFGPIKPAGPTSPRQRLAELVVKYFTEYGARPSPESLSQLALEAARRLGPEERGALEVEVAAVLRLGPPPDQRFVLDRVREQLEHRALHRAVIQAADQLEAGASAPAIRELLARAGSIESSDARTVVYSVDADERLAAWRRGDEYGERISTGLAGLDSVLQGGPTRREVHYFLAPPKGAKTAFLLKVASAAARRRHGVYVVTYEMQSIRMALRLDRMLARASKAELQESVPTPPGEKTGYQRLEAALQGLRTSGAGEIVIDERPPQRAGSVAEASARVQQIRRAGGRVDVVVLDYLNIMGSSRSELEKRHELARISRDIAAMARELDVLVWCAALVNRQAVDKPTIRKSDIAEAFEVVAVADGMVAICATREMVRAGIRRLYVAAAREEADEVRAGDYYVDFSRMTITPVDGGAVELLDSKGEGGE